MYDLKEMADLATKILETSGNQYLCNKNLIKKLFSETSGNYNDVLFRLTLIDSFYSTNMSKTLYSLEDITNNILNISEKDEYIINESKSFMEFKDDISDNKIYKLIYQKFGFQKGEIITLKYDNEDERVYGNHAYSLISKYLYFLNKFDFPIYDRLAKKSYKIICKSIQQNKIFINNDTMLLNKMPEQFSIEYFRNISNLNKISKIENYNNLDNLLWLLGKINKGSYSLLLNKKDFENMITKINNTKQFTNYKSNKVDKHIAIYLYNDINILDDFDINQQLKGDLIKFVEFAYNLNKKANNIILKGI